NVVATDQKHFAVGARNDDIAKIAGHRIDLNEVRALLRKAPNVVDANVRVIEDGDQTALKVFLVAQVPANAHDSFIAATRAWLSAQWQHAGHVSQWKVGDAVPTNSMGKWIDW
ncbi:MAG: hypothetical protein ACRDAM_07845, partial [Casimicrobium sp.]